MALEPPLILIVDDTRDTRELLELVLRGAGYRVECAEDGRAGLARAVELRPALVITDMAMPEMDGLELIEQLHREFVVPPRVIATSGFDAYAAEALARGAHVFLCKPYDTRHILGTVADVLSGAAPPPDRVTEHARQIRTHRRREVVRRDAIVDRIDFDAPAMRERLRSIVAWTAAYFGLEHAIVHVQRGDRIRIEAHGGMGAGHEEGMEVLADTIFCGMVVEARTPLIVGAPQLETVMRSHPAGLAGFRTYAGVPLRLPSGVVVGTLCLLDRHARELHGEDLSVLEALADGLGRHLGSAAGEDSVGPFAQVVTDVFTRPILDRLVAAALHRVDRDGGSLDLALIDLGTTEPTTYTRCARAVLDAFARERLGIGEYAPGVLGVILGSPARAPRAWIEDRFEHIAHELAARGVGMVSFEGDAALGLEPRSLEAIADEARSRSVASGHGEIHHLEIAPYASHHPRILGPQRELPGAP